MKKKYKIDILDTNLAFLEKMFGQYLLNKLTRTDEDIRDAVELWWSDPDAAIEKYGHISQWDVSNVTNMAYLFLERESFNEDISTWDVSNVINMCFMFYEATYFN